MDSIKEELDLGDQKKNLKGKTIKIKKIVKKETGSFTLKDTYISPDDQLNASNDSILNSDHILEDGSNGGNQQQGYLHNIPLSESSANIDLGKEYNFTKNPSPAQPRQ
jgi:hypothetical protein